MAETDIALDLLQVDSIGPINYFNREIEILKDAVEQCQRSLHIYMNVQQITQRTEEADLQSRERYQRAQAELSTDYLDTAEVVDQGWRDVKKEMKDQEEPAAQHALAYLCDKQLLAYRCKTLDLSLLSPETLDQEGTADVERLFKVRRYVGQCSLSQLASVPTCFSHSSREVQEEGYESKRKQGQRHIQTQHRDQSDKQPHDAEQHRHHCAGDNVLHPVDIVIQARKNLSAALGCVEAQRQSLQVSVQAYTQIVHNILTQRDAEIVDSHAEKACQR